MIKAGGVYVLEAGNLIRVEDSTRPIQNYSLLDNRLLIVRLGKSENVILQFED